MSAQREVIAGPDVPKAIDPPARKTMQVPLPLDLLISIGCVALVDSP